MVCVLAEMSINLKKQDSQEKKAEFVKAPMIRESPVSIECRVTEVKLGSHDMFLVEVLAVHADEEYMDENNRFDLNRARPLVYSHGEYLGTGKKLGTFGYSVKSGEKVRKMRGYQRGIAETGHL